MTRQWKEGRKSSCQSCLAILDYCSLNSRKSLVYLKKDSVLFGGQVYLITFNKRTGALG